ncbi:MAG: cation acetate symporter [Krumholzibacteria bacterium]|nr:cation acetate symporter [Candidatus Krumholzibacteria bacterium]
MNLHGTPLSIVIFSLFVALVLWLSWFFARKAKSASGYYAAGGQIHWAVNGISFAGDYLSAASFLGICGMIATLGYDGFLYSIGYLAGWVVALFVVAEPMKRMGKFTFTDALDAKFDHRGIKLAAAVSTLVVSICYLIPQMNGAGTLVEPLLGLPHWAGVILVGAIVITIVATAGMTSTTYVQFLKGGLLLVFSTILVVMVLARGLGTAPASLPGEDGRPLLEIPAQASEASLAADGHVLAHTAGDLLQFLRGEEISWWKRDADGVLWQAQWRGKGLVNGEADGLLRPVGRLRRIGGLDEAEAARGTGPVGPVRFLALLTDPETRIEQWHQRTVYGAGGEKYSVHYPHAVTGTEQMRPGVKFKVGTTREKLNFVSLMMALFFGTAALPHILIRYYTVPSPACARKSTIVAIAAIGSFYVLTLFMGLGAAINGTVNPADNNMSAPLLALSFGGVLFAVISAIAFATVLGTVAGLIVAASGAVAHDLMDRFGRMDLSEARKVRAGKIAAFGVGIVAIVLGIVFRGVNVSFLVGWAFAVAASANLPAIVMLLFWKGTTAQGIVASIIVGIVAALGIILTGPEMFAGPYGLRAEDAWHPLGQPGIISIPLSFLALVAVSLLTRRRSAAPVGGA